MAVLHPRFRQYFAMVEHPGHLNRSESVPICSPFQGYRWAPKSAPYGTQTVPQWLHTRFPNDRHRHVPAWTRNAPAGAVKAGVECSHVEEQFSSTDRSEPASGYVHDGQRTRHRPPSPISGILPWWNALGTGIGRSRCPFVHLFKGYRWAPKSALSCAQTVPRGLRTRFPDDPHRDASASTKRAPAGAVKAGMERSHVEEQLSSTNGNEPANG
ncbi:hypothetical protein EDD18DRAFT_170392 [Armillaria luteobubalina]|uniref:Uncharacterized protein n=1 Tax=Armillaria luteobubalina TaxID=153913 RepID=A0AA39P1S1_9AGAR|nr:hypothetical protein EDD18DRAFT_170392 [Armillaria luteobubalina]